MSIENFLKGFKINNWYQLLIYISAFTLILSPFYPPFEMKYNFMLFAIETLLLSTTIWFLDWISLMIIPWFETQNDPKASKRWRIISMVLQSIPFLLWIVITAEILVWPLIKFANGV